MLGDHAYIQFFEDIVNRGDTLCAALEEVVGAVAHLAGDEAGHREALGRDYDSIIKSAHVFITLLEPGQDPEEGTLHRRTIAGKASGQPVSLEEYRKGTFVGTPEETAEHLHRLKEAGVEYFVVYFRNDLTRFDTLQTFAREVMPVVREE